MALDAQVTVVLSGSVVDDASVSITSLLGVPVDSGKTNSSGTVLLSVPAQGTYVGIASKIVSGDLYADSAIFSTEPSGTTYLTLHLALVP